MTKRIRIAHLALLLTVACAVYANSIGNDFIWDDVELIENNPLIRNPGNLRKIATTHYWDLGKEGERVIGNYRPLTVASYLLNYQVAGADPAAFRVVNIALHALNTCLVYLLCAVLGLSWPAALVAGLLFAVHPVHVEAVVWITGRGELLACFGLLAAMYFHLRHRRDGAPSQVAASVVFFLLALLSKESAIAFIPIVIGLEIVLSLAEGAPASRVRSRVLSCLPYLLVSLAFLAVRYAVLGGAEDRGAGPGTFFLGSTAAEIFLTMVKVFAKYWALLLFPAKLSAHYDQIDIPVPESLLDPSFLAAVGVHVAVLAAIIALFRTKRHLAAFALSWVYLALLPYSHLVHFEWLMAERFLYIPSVGIALAAALAVEAVRRTDRAPTRRTAGAVASAALCAIALLAVRTVDRNRDWAHETEFFGVLAADKPTLAGARLGYGKALEKVGRYEEALTEYEAVVRLRPDLPEMKATIDFLRLMTAASHPEPTNGARHVP